MNLHIIVVPYGRMRYPTTGDWFWDEQGDLQIRVAELGDWKAEMAVALHEAVEVLLCKARGIGQEAVDAFDMSWEEAEGGIEEPGDDPKAPYYREHQEASGLERTFAAMVGLDWNQYDRLVMEVEDEK